MTNLFDGGGDFCVLRNQIGDFSFWPASATVPAGWEVVLDAAPRAAAEDFVRLRWTTLAPTHRVRAHGTDVRS